MDGVRKPTRKKKIPVFLSKKEYHTLIETIGDNWMRPLVMFAVGTGMRRAEILAQRWIDVESDLIHIRNHGTFTTKSGHERSIPISKLAREALKLQKEEGEYVFSNKNGGRLSPDLVTKAFRRWKKRAGLREEIHFHSCRHTFASWKAQAGVPLNRIQLWLGHSDSRQTEIYAHLLPENVLGEIDEGMI